MPAILGGREELLPHVQSVTMQAAGGGEAQIDGHFPPGMLERSVKLNYLFESYDNEMGWIANWFKRGFSSRRVSYKLGYRIYFIFSIIMPWQADTKA